MDTEIKNTVAIEPRRMASLASVRKLDSATEGAPETVSANNPSGKAVMTGQKGAGSPGNVDDSARLEEAVSDLNDYVQNVQRNLQFDLDDESGHTVIRVVDAETDEVIRQMPSEEFLALARHLKGMSDGGPGLFLKEKA